MDLLTIGYRLQLGDSARQDLLRILHRDAQFLSDCRFMDYSLLVDVQLGDAAAVGAGPGAGAGAAGSNVIRRLSRRLRSWRGISKSKCDRYMYTCMCSRAADTCGCPPSCESFSLPTYIPYLPTYLSIYLPIYLD